MSQPVHTALSQRSSGVLLHITSLPGPHGSGDLGAAAHHFVDWLVAAGQCFWQILPLSPVGAGYSPYNSPSTFAGNPLLIDLHELEHCGWLAADMDTHFDATHCDFARVAPWRMQRLRQAWLGFRDKATRDEWALFAHFRAQEAHWLADYALFCAIESVHGAPWTTWPQALARREPSALMESCSGLADEMECVSFVQWRFDVQWRRLRAYAHSRGIAIVGDAPIFVAHHSADVWGNPTQFYLDACGEPSVVAGVPPDYFSVTGQRWGNPLYRWDAMQLDGFAWWKSRLHHVLGLVDVVRLDHFRGFETYWEIPAAEPDAVTGRWCKGPGTALFEALAGADGAPGAQGLPIIAEDLGEITPAVTALRLACGFPGMRVMLFAFGDTAANPYLPHNFTPHTVAYTGTHDNTTALGWWRAASDAQRQSARDYLGPQADHEIHWAMMQALSQSVALTVIFPFQDVLGLDGTHRMNIPGSANGCWQWRFDWAQVQDAVATRLAAMTRAHGRNACAPI